MTFLDASFWVYLSTLVFLIIVVLKSYALISNYLEKQQQQIRVHLKEAEDVHRKALELYGEYKDKLEEINSESSRILSEAERVSKEIIDDSKVAIDRMIAKKKKEAEGRMIDYEEKVKRQLILKYATLVQDDMKKREISDDTLVLDVNGLNVISL